MAGSDQSRNLGGMLTQIAQTTGEMGGAFTPVMQEATKPRGDMNDPEHLQRLAQWASSNGDAQAANMYMTQARQVSSERAKKAKEAQDATKMQSANAVTAQYKKALESGDPALIAKAEEAVMAGANAHGYNAQDRMNAATTAVKSANDEAFKASERERVNQERAATQQFSQIINATEDPDEVMEAVKNAPPELADQAQRMANTRVTFLANAKAMEDAKAEDAAAVSTEFSMPTDLPEGVTKSLQAEHDRLVKLASEGKNADGTWKPGKKRELEMGMKALNKKALDAGMSLALAEESDKRQRLRTIDHRRQQVAIDRPTGPEAERIAEMIMSEREEAGTDVVEGSGILGFFETKREPTDAEITKRFRDEQYAALDAEVRSITGQRPAPAEAPAEGEVVAVATEAEALALPSGTRFSLPDGRTGTKQ